MDSCSKSHMLPILARLLPNWNVLSSSDTDGKSSVTIKNLVIEGLDYNVEQRVSLYIVSGGMLLRGK